MEIFSEMEVWVDSEVRSGAAHMAVDELILAKGLRLPLLRFYQWTGEEVSLGYFEKLADAQKSFCGDGVKYVRRWTGGGIVDHRVDFTYTLFVPKGHPLERLRGAGSYEKIHEALATSMVESGVDCSLTLEAGDRSERSCFVNPVPYDIVSSSGKKLAGAGQRRSRNGIMHQGSVQGIVDMKAWRNSFAFQLAATIEKKCTSELELDGISQLVDSRYANVSWLNKR